MTLTTEQLTELMGRATAAPWRVLDESECYSHDDGNTISAAIGKRNNHAFALAMHTHSESRVDANAALIALTPELAAEVIALRAENERMRDALVNLIIAIDMGWDLDGLIEVARAAINDTPETGSPK